MKKKKDLVTSVFIIFIIPFRLKILHAFIRLQRAQFSRSLFDELDDRTNRWPLASYFTVWWVFVLVKFVTREVPTTLKSSCLCASQANGPCITSG